MRAGGTVAAGLSAYLLTAESGTAHASAHVVLVVLGAASTAVTAAIPAEAALRQARERRSAEQLAEQAQASLRIAVADGLEPVTGLLAELVRLRGRRKTERRGEAVQATLTCAAGLVGVDRARVSLYVLRDGPPLSLVPVAHAGRSGAPRAPFVAGTPDGDAVLAVVHAQGRRYSADVRRSPPPGWAGSDGSYRTFVAVSVASGATALGMLTIDALQPGELAVEESAGLVDVFAHLLAAILSA